MQYKCHAKIRALSNYLHKYIEILQRICKRNCLSPSSLFTLLRIKVLCSLVVQEGVAVLLVLDRVNGRSLDGEGGWDRAALAQLFPSSGGESWAPPLALPTEMCADLGRPEAPHLAPRTHLIQLHRGLLIPGGNRRLLYSPLRYNMMKNIMKRRGEATAAAKVNKRTT